jgi:hypothetical protein
MKSTLLLLALASQAFAAQPMVPRVTSEDLAKLQQMDPMIRLAKPAEPQSARPQNQSIIGQSTILSDGTNWTFVPNGAVVFLPNALKTRVGVKPAGILLPWVEFLTRNLNWITTVEVTIAQAAGKAPLPADRAAFWTTQDKIVIATHQNGPISVRLPDTSRKIATR